MKKIVLALALLTAAVAAPAIAKWDDIGLCEVSFPC